MALILCIETATRLCSVALAKIGACIAVREEQSERLSHAERSNLLAAEVLEAAGVHWKDLDAIAVGIGPGSYTGSRIGVSAAKGWSFALDIPIIGISTLRTLAEAVLKQDPQGDAELWPMIDARRMEVYTQPYSVQGSILAPSAPLILDEAWVAQAVRPRMVFGDGADKATVLWQDAKMITHLPGIIASAGYMCAEAQRRYNAGDFDDLAYLVPQYGKAANVTRPGMKRPGP